MKLPHTAPDPYSAFKDDVQRTKALVSRDRRLTSIALVRCTAAVVIVIGSGSRFPLAAIARWLGFAA